MHRVDIIVPCYNYGRYLRNCVASGLRQEGVHVRILIIDDASKDDTEQIGRQLADEDSRVTYIRHPHNRGHIATYNEGLEWATQDYTLVLSADDMLTPGALYRATSLMETHPHVGFVFGRCIYISDDDQIDRTSPTLSRCDAKVWNGFAWLRFVFRDRSWMADSPTVLVRTEMYRIVGGFRPDLPHTADLDLWLRFAAHADVGEVEADQAYYRIHQKNMHGSLAPTALQSLEHWLAAFSAFFDHSGRSLPNEPQFREWAADGIARVALSAAYAKKYRRETELRRKLIELARRTSPSIASSRGQFAAGYEIGRIRQSWAVRRLLGAPAYLFRRAADHSWRTLRALASADAMGAAFEAGRVCGYLSLILDEWRGKPGPVDVATANGDCTPIQIGPSQRTAA